MVSQFRFNVPSYVVLRYLVLFLACFDLTLNLLLHIFQFIHKMQKIFFSYSLSLTLTLSHSLSLSQSINLSLSLSYSLSLSLSLSIYLYIFLSIYLYISLYIYSFSPQYYPWGLPLIFKSTAIFHSWDIKFIKLINPITLFIIFLFLINLKKNSENRNYLIPLIFLFLVNSRWLEMGKMAKNGQNAISMHKNDTFPIVIPILGQNRKVLNNSWVFLSFSIFGKFHVAGNGQNWPGRCRRQ